MTQASLQPQFRRSLRIRLVVGLGAILIPLLLLAGAGFYFYQQSMQAFDETVEVVFKEMVPVTRLEQLVLQTNAVARRSLIENSANTRNELAAAKARVDAAFDELAEAPVSRARKHTLLDAARRQWVHINETQLDGGQPLPQQLHALDSRFSALLGQLQQLHRLAHEEISQHRARAEHIRTQIIILIGAIGIAGLAAVILSGIQLTRSILGPVERLDQGARRLGAGELGYRIQLDSRDEFGQLARTFNQMAAMLEDDRDRLEELATRDELTGLHNKRAFLERMENELARARRYGKPFSIIILDVDHFKKVNDTYGHLAGDQFLRSLARQVHSYLRPTDFVARFGGEEIAIILPETDLDSAAATAERTRALLEAHRFQEMPDEPLQITASLGVSAFPDNGRDARELIEMADKALYRAKEEGRNRVCVAGKASPE